MTFTIKLRGDATGTVRHDYRCPVHGPFELDVPRADVPDAAPCPVLVRHPKWGPWEDPVACGAPSPWSPGSITCRVKLGEVVRGMSDERPPDHVVMDTRPLADGMPLHEFKARRKALSRELAIKQARTWRSR